jgi:hypothetical protein
MGGEGGSEPEPDTTPPTILSVSPADGEAGVLEDAVVTIRFSEPMDPTATLLAYDSVRIPLASSTKDWSEGDTVLTITPNAPLAYDDVTDPTSDAAPFELQIDDTAEDAAGNRLAADYSWSFTTLRRVTHTLAIPTANVLSVVEAGGLPVSCSRTNGVDQVELGYFDSTTFGLVNGYVLLSLDLTQLPDDVFEWEAGALSAVLITGTSHDIVVNDGVFLPPSSATWITPEVGNNIGILVPYQTAPGEFSIDVLPQLRDDYQERAARDSLSQYRLGFTSARGGTSPDAVYLRCSGFAVDARYLAP